MTDTLDTLNVERNAEDPDMVNNPPHYTQNPSGVECIEVIEHLPSNIAAAIKYLWRCDDKNNPEEDLNKAAWYINRELERRRKFNIVPAQITRKAAQVPKNDQ